MLAIALTLPECAGTHAVEHPRHCRESRCHRGTRAPVGSPRLMSTLGYMRQAVLAEERRSRPGVSVLKSEGVALGSPVGVPVG